jgi:hypothetical protein
LAGRFERQEGAVRPCPARAVSTTCCFQRATNASETCCKLAAAAGAGVAAGGFDAVGGGGDDPDIDQTVAFQRALDNLARQDAGHEDRAAFGIGGDAVPEVTETVDGNLHSAASA